MATPRPEAGHFAPLTPSGRLGVLDMGKKQLGGGVDLTADVSSEIKQSLVGHTCVNSASKQE